MQIEPQIDKPLDLIFDAEKKLRRYCEEADFCGWDPWDALAAPLFRWPPFNLRLPRWAANHLIKIAPLNLRPLLGIPQDCFAKGLALFISGYAHRQKSDPGPRNLEIICRLFERLIEKQIRGYSGPCWGTNVPYQTRAFFVPPETPSLVHTAFAVEAILDCYDLQPQPHLLELASGACRFILQDLRIREAHGGLYFSYTPTDESRVINVTALAARMLARTGQITQDAHLITQAKRAIQYVIATQTTDGSWPYGEDPIHQWIDNYHTGFVVDALDDYEKISGDDSAHATLLRGLKFYRDRLFLEDGTPKFSPASIWPIDGHCLAQGILTFSHHPEYHEFARRVAHWGTQHFQHPSGYFYFQRTRYWLNRIPHIRWVQAWIFLALNKLIGLK